MKRIAVTGGIACGKSTFAELLGQLGCDVWDADAAVHVLEAPGGAGVGPIVDTFGKLVRAPDGGIDRQKLGQLVFSDAPARARLNAILHPLAHVAMRQWMLNSKKELRVAVVPLFFEAGWDADGWDLVVCVACRIEEQERRLMARGFSKRDAQERMAAQMPLQDKISRSDCVVWNDSSIEALRQNAKQWMQAWTTEARI